MAKKIILYKILPIVNFYLFLVFNQQAVLADLPRSAFYSKIPLRHIPGRVL